MLLERWKESRDFIMGRCTASAFPLPCFAIIWQSEDLDEGPIVDWRFDHRNVIVHIWPPDSENDNLVSLEFDCVGVRYVTLDVPVYEMISTFEQSIVPLLSKYCQIHVKPLVH